MKTIKKKFLIEHLKIKINKKKTESLLIIFEFI